MKLFALVLLITFSQILLVKFQSGAFLTSREDYDNEKVIVNANGQEAPMIPVAAGIGGEGINFLMQL